MPPRSDKKKKQVRRSIQAPHQRYNILHYFSQSSQSNSSRSTPSLGSSRSVSSVTEGQNPSRVTVQNTNSAVARTHALNQRIGRIIRQIPSSSSSSQPSWTNSPINSPRSTSLRAQSPHRGTMGRIPGRLINRIPSSSPLSSRLLSTIDGDSELRIRVNFKPENPSFTPAEAAATPVRRSASDSSPSGGESPLQLSPFKVSSAAQNLSFDPFSTVEDPALTYNSEYLPNPSDSYSHNYMLTDPTSAPSADYPDAINPTDQILEQSSSPIGYSLPSTPPVESDHEESDHEESDHEESDHEGLNQETVNAVKMAARKIYSLLIDTDGGCQERDHLVAHSMHMQQAGGNHHPLAATYQDQNTWRKSARAELGLRADRFPENRALPRRAYPPAEVMNELFTGVPRGGDESAVPNICLHEELHPHGMPLISYDIDSVLAFPRTFGAFRKGFKFCPATQFSRNIRNDLHIRRRIQYFDRNGKERLKTCHLRDIPHLYIGTVNGFTNSTLYIFFPRLMIEDKKFTFLTQEQVKRFIDQAMWPACRAHLRTDDIQYFPQTQEMAEINARAKGVEHTSHQGELGLKQFTYHSIPPAALNEIWTNLQGRIADPHLALQDFQDAFLFVNVKGVKCDFKVVGSLHQTLSKYKTFIREIFDPSLMHRLIQDIGREICPVPASSNEMGSFMDDQAITYLWKKCCLEQQYQSIADEFFEGKKGTVNFYHIGFLRDAACMTLVPPRKTPISRAGWYYGQWYAVVKTVGDAQALYPFTHDRMSEVAIDKAVLSAHHHSTKSSRGRDRELPERTYCSSKGRVLKGYSSNEDIDFATRMEFRCDLDVVEEVDILADEDEQIQQLPVRLENHPRAVWPVTTKSFVNFMLGNYDKLTSAIEMATLTSPKTGVPFERSRLMMILLACLRNFSNCNLLREQALWYDVRAREGEPVRGLGFESTVTQHGFAWFHQMVDWEKFEFLPDVAPQMVGAEYDLLRWYGVAGRSIQDTAPALDRCCERLLKGCQSTTGQEGLLELMAHLCFRQFRRDELTALATEIRGSTTTADEMDDIQFCFDGLSEAVIDKLRLVSGHKTMTKTPEALVEWLWRSEGKYNRKHFIQKPFRIMYQKVETAVSEQTGLKDKWERLFNEQFFAYHWVWPYPDCNGTLISTQKETRARLWWSIDWQPRQRRWVWARTGHRSGLPPQYPSSLKMDMTELTKYLDRLGG